jgi:hypothetical protein
LTNDVLFFLFGANQPVDRTTLWTAVTAFITLSGFVVAGVQLFAIRKISRADFQKTFIDSFFVPDTRTLLSLLMNSAIEFDILCICEEERQIDELPYFRIRREIADQLAGIIPFDSHKKDIQNLR